MRRCLACVVLVLGLSVPLPAAADPIPVTGGFFVSDFEGHFFTFLGTSFAIQGITDPATCCLTIPVVRPPSCSAAGSPGCAPGDVVNLSFATTGETSLGSARATVGGVEYGTVDLRGTLQFDVTPVPFSGLPVDSVRIITGYAGEPIPVSVGPPNFLVESPFLFTGHIRGLLAGAEVFSLTLYGSGTASMPFEAGSTTGLSNSGDYDSLESYQFSVDPVPEPTTLLLVGSGIAVGLTRRRSRRIERR